jgi:prevent-host-death family protein
MTKKVKISDLKAHLSAHLRRVRRGGEIIVLDRDTPVAKIVPFEEKKAEKPMITYSHIPDPSFGRLGDWKPSGPPIAPEIDMAETIIEDRRNSRY